jgi:hypothetical protein
MQNAIVQQAVVIQFNFNAHHQWAKCPLCLSVGPQREQVIKHLNTVHSLPGENWECIEAHDIKAGLNTFWVAVRLFDPAKVKQSTPEQDKKALESMRKANAVPKAILDRIARADRQGRGRPRHLREVKKPTRKELLKKLKPEKKYDLTPAGNVPTPRQMDADVLQDLNSVAQKPKKVRKKKSKKKGGKK